MRYNLVSSLKLVFVGIAVLSVFKIISDINFYQEKIRTIYLSSDQACEEFNRFFIGINGVEGSDPRFTIKISNSSKAFVKSLNDILLIVHYNGETAYSNAFKIYEIYKK